jgi:hypothetical protein
MAFVCHALDCVPAPKCAPLIKSNVNRNSIHP